MRKLLKKASISLLLCLFMATSAQVSAQDIQIKGTVKDASTGEVLPGVNVTLQGTTRGTTTDINGFFELSAPKGGVIEFSFIGFLKETLVAGEITTVDISLSPDIAQLSEVVVIGYGTVKKADATGSVATVGSADFNKGAITSAQELLVGKSAGVVITTSGGAPGSGATIRVRGGSSLNASNDPLIIVDGVPLDNNGISGSNNFLAFVNPNDIESFTVLKDASATAIYGSRASNGVIIITTKKGREGSAMKLQYDEITSVSSAIEFIDVYSGDEVRQIAFDHPELYAPDTYTKLGSENTDWQKELFRTAISTDHNLSLTGAYKTMPYRASIGYTDQKGIMKNTDMQRITGSISLSPTFLNKDLKVNLNAKGMLTDHNFGDAGALGSAVTMDPTQPIKDGNAASDGYFQWSNYGANLGTPNPVEQLMEADNKSTVKRFIGNVQLDYTLPFLRDLHANLNLATDFSKSEGHNNRPTTSPSVLTSPLWGRLSNYNGNNKNKLLDFYLNYTKDLAEIKSRVDVTAGYSWQHFERENFNYARTYVDTTIDAETGKQKHPYQSTDSTRSFTENYLVSFFGRVNYSFDNKYLLTFTIRDDGSSRFSQKNRWGLFPSAAFAWRINQESFLKDVSAISDLKLRVGWGITGQQDIGNDYPSQAIYIQSSPGSYYYIDGKYIPTLRPSAYDPDIKWESTTTKNLALDFGLFKERVRGTIEIYNRVTDDLLNLVDIPTGSNFSNKLLTNVGSLENNGVELSLDLVPISQKDMSLTLGFNFTYNENKITKLLISDDPEYIGILYGDAFTGQKQVTRVGYPAYSYFLNKQVYDVNGNPIEGLYVDISGKGGTVNGNNEDKYLYHNPVADYLIGFSARFNYKNFDFSASSRSSIGNYVYNQLAAGASYDQMSQIGYWKNFPTYLSDTKFVKRQFTSDYFVKNASFFKLDNISAGYNFDNIAGKFGARLSFTVQNAITITKYEGIDPEVPGGIDNNFYPRPRTFMLGISLTY
ncbi:MAG: TonB-dependent receptor [Bacteroidales bacterium]